MFSCVQETLTWNVFDGFFSVCEVSYGHVSQRGLDHLHYYIRLASVISLTETIDSLSDRCLCGGRSHRLQILPL